MILKNILVLQNIKGVGDKTIRYLLENYKHQPPSSQDYTDLIVGILYADIVGYLFARVDS